METIFYVLFRSPRAMHYKMENFDEEKTFSDYMIWQKKRKDEIESELGHVVVENFDIKYRKVTN